MDMLFPPGSPTRVPIAAITGTNGKTTTSRMLGHILKMTGFTVGMTSTDGVYIDGKLTVSGDMTGPKSTQMILCDPSIDAAVLEVARGGMIRSGLGFRRANVAACLNVSADHLGLRGIDTLEQLAEIKRVPIEVAQDAAVVRSGNAERVVEALGRGHRVRGACANVGIARYRADLRCGGDLPRPRCHRRSRSAVG